jgi:hypothetical protein
MLNGNLLLRQSTAVTFSMGPMLDAADGDTEETGLSIAAADVKLSKNNGALGSKNDATAPTHDANGFYRVTLNATDTGTVGPGFAFVHVAGARPVKVDFAVLTPNVFDAMVSGGLNLPVNAVAISGDQAAADNLEADYDATGYAKANSSIGQVTALATDAVSADALKADAAGDIADAVWDEARSGHVVAGSFGEGVVVNSIATDAVDAAAVALDALRAIVDEWAKRDYTAITGEAAKSNLNAMRKLLNDWNVSGGVLTVFKEDGVTVAYTQQVAVDALAKPIVGLS